MNNLILEIRKLIEEYVYNMYKEYLTTNNLLLIKQENIKSIITNMYTENSKNIKQYVRNSLKKSMKDDYPCGTVENILLDIFQDKDNNISKLTKIIDDYQNNNYFEIEKSICNNQLGMSIKLDGSFCEIGIVKDETFKDKDIIEKYMYLYSIDKYILNEQPDVINCIKSLISKNSKVNIGVYKLITE
tara:strand:- start:5981 stop:6541 length:561 start_codon:yes stop_codon:yes gene_type:complete